MLASSSIRSSLRATQRLSLSPSLLTLSSINSLPIHNNNNNNNQQYQHQPLSPHITTRGKRTKKNAAQAANVQRIVTQLSVFSARKKQPRQIKLCLEDLLRHNATTRAWAIYQSQIREKHEAQLQAQYNKIVDACQDLESTEPFLAFEAIKRERGKRFTPEIRVPTETPPNTIWQENWNAETYEALINPKKK